jgi:hypothetical protein
LLLICTLIVIFDAELLVHIIKFLGHYKRGPTRGLKSRRWREKHPTIKPTAKISDSMRRVIGERSAEFISDCSRWVREYCPLKAR